MTDVSRPLALPLVVCLALAGAIACGSDDGGSADAGGAGDTCPQVGMTMTGCHCTGQPAGVRHCTEDLVWSDCECPPAPVPGTTCQRENQPVRCDPCEGETIGRDTYCTADLTFDCSCPGEDDGGTPPDAGL